MPGTQKRAPRGSRPRSTPSAPEERQIDKDLYVRMFRTMTLMRAVEDRMVSMYRQGEMLGSVYTGHWHEAIAVGTAAALRPSDFLAPLHRDLGAHLWRGTEPRQVMASFLGKATAPTGGRDGTLHYGRLDLNINNPPSHIPDNFPVATGAAFAFRYRGQDGVALAYCGDGSTSRGDFHEALNWAGVQKLPVVFILENNQYAYSTPLDKQFAVDPVQRAAAYGFGGVTVDGNDVEAMFEAVRVARERAIDGGGPTLIEAVTMRMHGHAAHDDMKYVPKEQVEEWRKRDPIERQESRLAALGVDVEAIRAEVTAEIEAATEEALAAPMPDPDTALDGVFCEGEAEPLGDGVARWSAFRS